MVSGFQKELEKLPVAKGDFCHEVKEIIDAIEYLEDDIAQAELARDNTTDAQDPVHSGDVTLELGNVVLDLKNAKKDALQALEKAGCPLYKEY